MIQETATATASAATANKIAGGGYIIVVLGWLSDANNVALIGLAITMLGGIWSFVSFLQHRKDAKAKRAEEREEHEARMRLIELEIGGREAGRRGRMAATRDAREVSNG